ncbi:MAG: transporter substrate-binding domain-containing protein [Treponema sp.]|jgi:polar amino acid transport system substrate-binding protein|nr:transporter substrate-binding domain-containing protein [Treponema sp.]
MNLLSKKLVMVVLLAAVLIIALSAGGNRENVAKGPEADGKLTVATSPDFPPYESIGANGEYVGFDIDMAHAIGEQLGLEVVIVSTEFDGIVSAVSTGKADIGMSGLSVTEERKNSVDFTVNIANEPQVILVKKGSSISSPADLAGKRVGSQNGTTGLDLAKYDSAIIAKSNYPGGAMGKPAEGVGYDDCILAAEDLKAGKIDAIIYDNSPLVEIAAQNPELEILTAADGTVIDLYSFYNAYITQKGNGFVDKVNNAIAALKANGKLALIYAKYPIIIPAP